MSGHMYQRRRRRVLGLSHDMCTKEDEDVSLLFDSSSFKYFLCIFLLYFSFFYFSITSDVIWVHKFVLPIKEKTNGIRAKSWHMCQRRRREKVVDCGAHISHHFSHQLREKNCSHWTDTVCGAREIFFCMFDIYQPNTLWEKAAGPTKIRPPSHFPV